MISITYNTVSHRNKNWILVKFKSDEKLNARMSKVADAQWSQSLKGWLIPDTEPNRIKCKLQVLNNLQLETTGRKNGIKNSNEAQLQKFIQQLTLKAYSPSTIRTYTSEMMTFLHTLKNVPAETMTAQRIKDYLQYCFTTLKLSEATLQSRMNALKFYYEKVLQKEKFFWEIPRPKKSLLLPKVISKEQIALLINAIENIKHKTIIMLAYACGLRVSEVVSLKVKHIDSNRKIILIEKAKGKKGRIVTLSPGILIMLREYYKQYKPKDYLFEGQFDNQHLTARSIQQVLQNAKEKAGIKQAGNMHMLRHSFATHLLDKGIDVVFIQKLLGHNDIKTTLRYLHVTNKDLINILSPLDDIEYLLKK